MLFQEQMNEFKEKYIYASIYKTEKEEKSYPFWHQICEYQNIADITQIKI